MQDPNARSPALPDRAHGVKKRAGVGRWIFIPVAALAVAGITWFVHSRKAAEAAAAKQPPEKSVPVIAATVAASDVPVYKWGIGSVAAFATVTIRSQVDGRIDKLGFIEGQDVKKGDLIAQIDPRPFAIQLNQAQAALARDTVQAKDDRLNLERFVTLAQKNLVPQQQVDDQRATTEALEATMRADQAQIASAQLNLSYAHITSPIDGRTGIRMVDPGNLVHATDATGIVVVTQLDPIVVFFTLPEDDLPDVAKASAAGTLPIDAFSRDGKTNLGRGELALIDNEINPATGTIRIKGVFPNHDHMLWPSQFVKARLLVSTRKNALVVPSSVIQRGPKGTFAYVVDATSHVTVRPVETEAAEGDFTVATSGLNVGDQVVVDGQYALAPGAKVSLKPPGSDAAPASSGSRSASKAGAAPSASSSAGPATP
jgi:multidrug efflux system membrane fusion protein